MRTRQITRVVHDDPRGPYSVQQFVAEKGEFDQFLEDLNDPHKEWGAE